MVGEESVLRFFYLNPDDGTLTLRRSLDESTLTAFNVRVHSLCNTIRFWDFALNGRKLMLGLIS